MTTTEDSREKVASEVHPTKEDPVSAKEEDRHPAVILPPPRSQP